MSALYHYCILFNDANRCPVHTSLVVELDWPVDSTERYAEFSELTRAHHELDTPPVFLSLTRLDK